MRTDPHRGSLVPISPLVTHPEGLHPHIPHAGSPDPVSTPQWTLLKGPCPHVPPRGIPMSPHAPHSRCPGRSRWGAVPGAAPGRCWGRKGGCRGAGGARGPAGGAGSPAAFPAVRRRTEGAAGPPAACWCPGGRPVETAGTGGSALDPPGWGAPPAPPAPAAGAVPETPKLSHGCTRTQGGPGSPLRGGGAWKGHGGPPHWP